MSMDRRKFLRQGLTACGLLILSPEIALAKPAEPTLDSVCRELNIKPEKLEEMYPDRVENTWWMKNVSEFEKVGTVSYYEGNKRQRTASGLLYKPGAEIHLAADLTRKLPMGTVWNVRNTKNDQECKVIIADVGGRPDRLLDVSEYVADLLGFTEDGLTKGRIEYLPVESRIIREHIMNQRGA